MEEECCAGQYVYKECRKNYADPLGGHAVDGCREFVPGCGGGGGEHTHGTGPVWCAACGCHRSFHRKVPVIVDATAAAAAAPSAAAQGSKRRRARTTFSEEQKERMQELAERIGWKMKKGCRDRQQEQTTTTTTSDFLGRTGVSERAFRIWMHNHRHASSTRAAESSGGESEEGGRAVAAAIAAGADDAGGNDNVIKW